MMKYSMDSNYERWGDEIMCWLEYEMEKAKLREINLTAKDYEVAVKKLAEMLKI